MDRRLFLKSGVSTALLPLLSPLSTWAWELNKTSEKPRWAICGHSNDGVEGIHSKDISGQICILDLETWKTQTYPINAYVHKFVQHPAQKNVLVGISKWGIRGVIFDLKKKNTIQDFVAPTGYRYFGHACFDESRNRMLVTAHNPDENKGGICVYDSNHWKFLELIDTGGANPHECIVLNDQLCIANSDFSAAESKGNIQFFDLPTLKAARSYATPPVAHVTPISANRLAISGIKNSEPAHVSVLNTDTGEISNFQNAKNYGSEVLISDALSLTTISQDCFAATLPAVGRVVCWNFKTNELQHLPHRQPIGLAFLNGQLLVTSGTTGKLTRYSWDQTRQKINQQAGEKFPMGNGKHLLLAV